MNPDDFAFLTRSIGSHSRRRAIFGGAIAANIGMLLTGFNLEDAAGKKRKSKKKKKKQPCTPARVCGATCCPVGTVCAGGVCRNAGTCQPTDNLCSVVATCNGNGGCGCLTHFTDGAKLCGTSSPDGCAINCQTDTDCAAFGAGSFCVRKTGDICCFGLIPINQGFCAQPCPT